jgi:hypothetical protein
MLKLWFNGTGIANIADNAASAPLTSIYVSLHTADPGSGGNQTTNEATYTSYARVAVARTTAGWTVVGSAVNPVNPIAFPIATGSISETETWAAAGTAPTGTGKILYRGPLTPGIAVAPGVTPQVTTTSSLTES